MFKPVIYFYEFGPFRLDPAKRLLTRDGLPVTLTPKAFDTLLALVESQVRVLNKDDLMRQVWPNTVVEENNLAQHIFALRKALGESKDAHAYIVTVPGRGYQFVAPVQELRDGADLVMGKHSRSRIVIEEETNGYANADGGLQMADSATAGSAPLAATTLPVSRANRRKLLLFGIILAVGIAGIALALKEFSPLGQIEERAAASFPKPEMTVLTSTGRQGRDAAISPDGKFVAYIRWEGDRQSLWVMQVDAFNNQQLVPPAEARYSNLSLHVTAIIFTMSGSGLSERRKAILCLRSTASRCWGEFQRSCWRTWETILRCRRTSSGWPSCAIIAAGERAR